MTYIHINISINSSICVYIGINTNITINMNKFFAWGFGIVDTVCSGRSPHQSLVCWLIGCPCSIVIDNDEAQALPHAGTLELLFLATRAESRSLCVGIALVLRDMHRQASSASWHVLLSHRLEPKLRCMWSVIYWRQGLQDGALFLRQGPQSGALLYVHDKSWHLVTQLD